MSIRQTTRLSCSDIVYEIFAIAQLTLTSQPQTSGTYCPRPVTFTCVGTQIAPSLFWRVNGSNVVTYVFQQDHNFPLTLNINPPLDGATVEIHNASINPPGSITIDITSVLTVVNASVLSAANLQCATSSGLNRQSNTLLVEVDNSLCKFTLYIHAD